MAVTAAQMASCLYSEEEDPEGAFFWWLSPCGGADLVPGVQTDGQSEKLYSLADLRR